MAAKKEKNAPKGVPVLFQLAYDGDKQFDGNVKAFAFDRTGNFITEASVEKDQVSLNIPDTRLSSARVFFAPAIDLKEEVPTLDSMARLHAYEPIWQYNPQLRVQEILPVPEIVITDWILCICRVRGRVVRPVDIGGTTVDRPVCNARVHVCEVDKLPIFIYKLPDEEIFRIRDWLTRKPFPPVPEIDPERFPQPISPPGPFPDFRIESASDGLAFVDDANLQLNVPARSAASIQALSATSFTPALQSHLLSNSAQLIRQAMIDHIDVIFPYLCWWPWLFWRYRCDEILTMQTDHQGRFDRWYLYPCNSDKPDLYFWVEYQIGGTWETVYRRPIPCNTYWNYTCGSEVIIRITDPRVPPCDNPPDLTGCQVAIMSIGNNVSVAEIQKSAAGVSQGLTNTGRPFGGDLEPHVWFSRTALFAKGVTHYRWSYRRLTGPNGITPQVGGWHVMDRAVVRHYSLIDQVTENLSFPVDIMGPDPTPAISGQQLFRIQPINTPASGIDSESEWVVRDAREDTASAFFETDLLSGSNPAAAAGKYEMKLELFKSDGSLVNMTAEGISVKEATTPAPIGTGTEETALASSENLITNGTGDVVGYRLVVWVDNNPCVALNQQITGAGLTIDALCGFVEYAPGATATLHFRAFHPNNFATLHFDTHRGSSIDIPEASASGAVGLASVNGFVRSAGGFYQKTLPVTTLLTSNTPPASPSCQSAAFAQTLRVEPMATDGWQTLTGLRAVGTPLAYALTPLGS